VQIARAAANQEKQNDLLVPLPALAPEKSGRRPPWIHTESEGSSGSKSNRNGTGLDELIVLSRFIHFTTLALLFGGSLFRLCVEPQQGYDRSHWPRIIDRASLAVLISALLGWLALLPP
jgi:hypothetical protein